MGLFATLTSGSASSWFEVPVASDVYVTAIGDFTGGGVIELHVSADRTTVVDCLPDGSAVAIATTGESRRYALQPGLYYRWNAGAVTSVAIHMEKSPQR